MPIYTNDPCDDGVRPFGNPLYSSVGIGPKVTKAIDAATKEWLDDHPEATTTVEDDSITNVKLKDNAINARTIEDNSIVTSKIANEAVTTPKIADGSITDDKLSSNAVDAMPTMSSSVRGVAKVGAGLAMNGDAIELSGGSIAPAVNAWLDAHPEATTTVQDNSITASKLTPNIISNSNIMDGTISDEKIASSTAKKRGTASASSAGYTFSLTHLVLYAGIPYVIKSEDFTNTVTTYVRLPSGTNVGTFSIPAGSTTYSVFIPEEDLFDVGIAHWFTNSGNATVTIWRMEDASSELRHHAALIESQLSRIPARIDSDWFIFGTYTSSSSFDSTNGWALNERKRICIRPIFLNAGSKIKWEHGDNELYISIIVFGYNDDYSFDHSTIIHPAYDRVDWHKDGSYVVCSNGWVVIVAATTDSYSTSTTIIPDMFDSVLQIESPWQSSVFENTGKNLVDIGKSIGASNADTRIAKPVHTYDGHILKLNWSHASSQYWIEFNGSLPAGTYTLSSKVRFEADANASNRNILMGVGEGYEVVVPKTRYNGTTILPSELEGFVYLTVTLDNESNFRIILEAQAQSNQYCEFYEIQLEVGDAPTPYVSPFTAIDSVARSGNGDGYLTSEQVAERTFNASYHIGADDFASKCTQFSTMMYGDYIAGVQAPSDCEAFLFFTDPHLLEKGSDWEPRMREYISQIQKYYNSTPTTFCLSGGDWLGNSDLPSEACFKMGYIDGFMHSMFNDCYMLVGNHDTNYQGKIDEQSASWTTRLSDDAIRNLWYRGGKAYYEFMGAATRFFCFDTGIEAQALAFGNNYGYEQANWFAERLATNTAEHVAIAAHILYYNSENAIQPLTQLILDIAHAFNSRESITVADSTYDYANASGKVEFGIFGHNHRDATATVSGIPCLITTWIRDDESYGPTFDLVFVDYDSSELKTVRVGSGSDRTMQI